MANISLPSEHFDSESEVRGPVSVVSTGFLNKCKSILCTSPLHQELDSPVDVRNRPLESEALQPKSSNENLVDAAVDLCALADLSQEPSPRTQFSGDDFKPSDGDCL